MNAAEDYIPPQNLEMEQAVLGSMLLSQEAIETADDALVAADFYRAAHGIIFDAILSLYRRKEPVDVLTVQEALRIQNMLETCGGTNHLVQLMNSVAATSNAPFYAKIVRDKAILRRLMDASKEIQSLVHSDYEDIEIVLAAVEEVITTATVRKVTDNAPEGIAPLINSAFDEVERWSEEKKLVTGIQTGIDELDYMTRGWQPQTMVVVGARPGGGKTALGAHFALAAAKEGRHVFIASQEMSKRSISLRLMATQGRVDGHRMRTGTLSDDDWKRLGDTCGKLQALPITIAERQMTLAQLRMHCLRQARHTGLDLVVLDYLQLMKSEGKAKENRTTEVSAFAEGLHDLATELGVCIIALAQSSRAVDARPDHRPVLSDLRDSGQIEAAADVVLFPFNPLTYQSIDKRTDCEEIEIIVAKNRDGMVGSARALWFPRYTAFGNVARYDEDPKPRTEPARMPYASDGPVNPMEGWNP